MSFCVDNTTVVYPLFQEECSGSIPTSALDFIVTPIELDRCIELNFKWHSRLPKIDRSNIVRSRFYKCYGFECGGVFYGVALWSSPVNRNLDNGKTMELRRCALNSNCPKNTASRVVSVMIRLLKKSFPFIDRLISYQDTDVHLGTMYKACGWVLTAKCRWHSWNTPSRNRNETQSTSDKNRWELYI